jgi:oxygen-independent coproporphyrinogen-3 oxidase
MKTSLYFHIPFCSKRCGYCDFVTFAGFERLIPAYLTALNLQVEQVGKGQKVHTIYFGGGTPSLVPPVFYEKLFKQIGLYFEILNDCEISLEANPGTVELSILDSYRKEGFNRISFGMQSARKSELDLLERSHKPGDIKKAVHQARMAGFDNLNLDLIFGLPGQTLENWQYSLEVALDLKPEHLSLYSLIVEEGTPLANQIAKGSVQLPDEDMAAEQYEWSCERLEKAGFSHYEISNWAKSDGIKDYSCQHNLQYWRLLPYLGFGTGAVGFIPGGSGYGSYSHTMTNKNSILKFISDVNAKASTYEKYPYMNQVSDTFEKETRMFVGFRLLEEGININDYIKRFHSNPNMDYGEIIDRLIKQGLIKDDNETRLCLTKKGWLVANRVFREFTTVEY